MEEYLQNIEFWHWWVAALVFVILEVFAPSTVIIWLGASAAVMGALLFAFPTLPWAWQFGIWAVLSIITVLVWHKFLKKPAAPSDAPGLNKRGASYVGRVFTLDEPMVNGYGKIRVDDSTWKIKADQDYIAGVQVKVTHIDGAILIVEKA